MKNSKSYNRWIEAAYLYFAEEGPKNLSIMALAKLCGLPRTNFYYYFENKEDLIDKIIVFHFRTTTDIFNTELEKRLNSFMPDLFVITYEFKLGIQFTKQLFKNREHVKFNEAYKQTTALSADLIVPKFMDFLKIDLPFEAGKSLWFTLTDTWYSRINFENFTVDSLSEISYEVMASVIPLIKKNN